MQEHYMCDKTSRSTLLACSLARLLVSSSLVAAKVSSPLSCMSAGCIESKKDAVQDHVSRQQRRPLSQQGPATVLRSPSADLAQRSQCSSSTRGTKDAISPTARHQASARADVRICVSPSPHSSRESRWCTVVEIQYLWRASEAGPIWGLGFFAYSEE